MHNARQVPATLAERLEGLGSVVVAYSGGVDSTYLAWAAHEVLPGRMLAVTADSPSLPAAELADAVRLAESAGFPHDVVRTDEYDRPAYRANDASRCWHCKEALFDALVPMARSRGLSHLAIGTVTDDLSDTRPGLRSARERGVRQPLLEAGLAKADVRDAARHAGLPVWDKPAAACLASRIPTGTTITLEALRAVGEAEAAVRRLGFRVVRVRHEGAHARVEVGAEEVERASAEPLLGRVLSAVRAAGFESAAVDPVGYRRPGGGPAQPVRVEIGGPAWRS